MNVLHENVQFYRKKQDCTPSPLCFNVLSLVGVDFGSRLVYGSKYGKDVKTCSKYGRSEDETEIKLFNAANNNIATYVENSYKNIFKRLEESLTYALVTMNPTSEKKCYVIIPAVGLGAFVANMPYKFKTTTLLEIYKKYLFTMLLRLKRIKNDVEFIITDFTMWKQFGKDTGEQNFYDVQITGPNDTNAHTISISGIGDIKLQKKTVSVSEEDDTDKTTLSYLTNVGIDGGIDVLSLTYLLSHDTKNAVLYLNPSDCSAIMGLQFGYYTMMGYGNEYYVGEEILGFETTLGLCNYNNLKDSITFDGATMPARDSELVTAFSYDE